jgi:hypothetical protein
MSSGFLIALLLAAATPEHEAARAELDAVAARIEQLKVRHAAGEAGVLPELHRLLVRAQELALTLDRIDRIDRSGRPVGHPPVRRAAPTAEELRERADAARDEADRIGSALQETEARLAELRAGALAPRARFTSAGPGPAPAEREQGIARLEAQRARLARALVVVLAQAGRLEAEADLLDSTR